MKLIAPLKDREMARSLVDDNIGSFETIMVRDSWVVAPFAC